MPAHDVQQCTYTYPWELVTLSFWHKYDSHQYVKHADVLSRHVDGDGRLHSRRLLTIQGGVPWIFRSFIPAQQLYILESSVVDPRRKSMRVTTRNVSFERAFVAEGQSRYDAGARAGHTDFCMDMVVTAWVGVLSSRFESFLLPRMAGNAQQGQQAVTDLCQKLSERYPAFSGKK